MKFALVNKFHIAHKERIFKYTYCWTASNKITGGLELVCGL